MKLAARVRPKTLLGEASSYLLAQSAPLSARFDHGQTHFDINLVEEPNPADETRGKELALHWTF